MTCYISFGARKVASTVKQSVLKSAWLFWITLLAAPVVAQQPAPQRSSPTPEPRQSTISRAPARVSETLIDSSVPDDRSVDQMLSAYSPKVRALDNIVGTLKGELRKSGVGAGSIGNFVTDGMRAQAALRLGKPIDVAIMNGGGMRRNSITEGELRARDIFELLPFENSLITLDLTGEQLLKLLEVVISGREGQSGARLTYATKADKSSQLEKAKLLDASGREKDIDPRATYTIVTIDYLYSVGGRYSVLREGTDVKALGITLRDAVTDYVKSETAAHRDIKARLDDRYVLDTANSVPTDGSRPN